MDLEMYGDAVVACADLVARSGASDFEIGYAREGVPIEDAGWYAVAKFQEARITAEERRSPTEAALALAERLLRGAACRCGRQATLSGDGDTRRCRWRLMGRRWTPSCKARPVKVRGERGDLAAMQAAMAKRKRRAERNQGSGQ